FCLFRFCDVLRSAFIVRSFERPHSAPPSRPEEERPDRTSILASPLSLLAQVPPPESRPVRRAGRDGRAKRRSNPCIPTPRSWLRTSPPRGCGFAGRRGGRAR